MPTTSPDGIYYADGSTPMSAEDISAAEATSVQNALSSAYRLRQIVNFTSSGTFTKASYPWLKAIRVICVGGGGGGGGAPTTAAGQAAAGSGGGAGAYSESLITNIAGLAASVSVTVGARGDGVINANGTNGGTSSFGSLVTAPGGSGGTVGIASSGVVQVEGGAGGVAGTGNFTVPGNPGGHGNSFLERGLGGIGGASFYGGAGQGNSLGTGSANGGDATGVGGGGGGGGNRPSTGTARRGGHGRAGIVRLELYS